MRHKKSGRILGRKSPHRTAMYRNMVTSLMRYGQIRTTDAKARELRRFADRLISLGKKVPPSALLNLTGVELEKAKAARVHAIRVARKYSTDLEVLERVFNEYAERYQGRNGGYTRVLKLTVRPGDNAPMALVELVSSIDEVVDEGGADSSEQESAAQESAAAE
jgi:large subunit ribosomal protein L17